MKRVSYHIATGEAALRDPAGLSDPTQPRPTLFEHGGLSAEEPAPLIALAGWAPLEKLRIIGGSVETRAAEARRRTRASPSTVRRHLPPGTSKWNKIEHRLFSFITHELARQATRSRHQRDRSI